MQKCKIRDEMAIMFKAMSGLSTANGKIEKEVKNLV
jgi:hypothetical protein